MCYPFGSMGLPSSTILLQSLLALLLVFGMLVLLVFGMCTSWMGGWDKCNHCHHVVAMFLTAKYTLNTYLTDKLNELDSILCVYMCESLHDTPTLFLSCGLIVIHILMAMLYMTHNNAVL